MATAAAIMAGAARDVRMRVSTPNRARSTCDRSSQDDTEVVADTAPWRIPDFGLHAQADDELAGRKRSNTSASRTTSPLPTTLYQRNPRSLVKNNRITESWAMSAAISTGVAVTWRRKN